MLFMKGTADAPQCGFSRTAVGLLRDEGADFSTFDILEDQEVRQGLKEFSNWPTYPQVSLMLMRTSSREAFKGSEDLILCCFWTCSNNIFAVCDVMHAVSS